MLWIVLASVAVADTWGPYDDGFVSPARDDAPTDGVLVYAANFVPDATVVEGPGAPFSLQAKLLTGVGAPPRAALLPPEGGWEAGASYTVAVTSYGYEATAPPTELTFTTGLDPAGPADALAVGEPRFGEWSEEQEYPWGCCHPTRLVEITVEVPGADEWGWVEIVGAFDLGRPSQITTEPIHTHLDLALGPGEHVLSFTQWLDDEEVPQPPCFDVVAVSAAGVPGAVETFCSDTVGLAEPTSSGCAHGGLGPAAFAPLLLLVYRSRSRRDESSRKGP